MKRLGLMLSLIAAGCGGPDLAPPAADSAQIVVALSASARDGVARPRSGGMDNYGGGSEAKGRQFSRVNYDDLADIVVYLEGDGLGDAGPAPRSLRLEISEDGADHRQLLLAPSGLTSLTIANRASGPRSVFAMGNQDGFDVTLAPGEESRVTLKVPGTYELACDEDAGLAVTIIVAPTTWAQIGEAGDDVAFDRVPPGPVEIVVVAPRLPRWSRRVTAAAGRRESVTAEVGVNSMTRAK
ncbi:MAG: hypothetical protein HUU15_04935 [Candidatus Brocadiae bacterium]|nr:hypothetical protein [Candidatus Brocadiia bacterium]